MVWQRTSIWVHLFPYVAGGRERWRLLRVSCSVYADTALSSQLRQPAAAPGKAEGWWWWWRAGPVISAGTGWLSRGVSDQTCPSHAARKVSAWGSQWSAELTAAPGGGRESSLGQAWRSWAVWHLPASPQPCPSASPSQGRNTQG